MPPRTIRRPRSVIIQGLFQLGYYLIWFIKWSLILSALFSTLASFNVIDTRNRLVWTIGDFLYRLTEPVLRPIRNVLPNFGNIDLSPLVAILLLQFIAIPILGTLENGIRFGVWSLV